MTALLWPIAVDGHAPRHVTCEYREKPIYLKLQTFICLMIMQLLYCPDSIR